MSIKSSQIAPGMVLSIRKKYYRVESALKVSVAKGSSFIKVQLRDLITDEVLEKNFKLDQAVTEVSFEEKQLEYLFPENKDHLFLDIDSLDQIIVPSDVVGDRINYLKEGVGIKATVCGEVIFSTELPQFLELMVARVDGEELDRDMVVSNATKVAILETGAKIEVPLFIEIGDVVKVDTSSNEYVQRI
jgi:elongation factor P